MKIDELNLSTRTYNTLLRAGITTVDKIKGMTDEELKNVRNLSKECLNEVKRAVYCTDCEKSIIRIGWNACLDMILENALSDSVD